MSRTRWFALCGVLAVAACGCGDDGSKPAGNAPAGGTAAAAAGVDVGAGMSAEPGGIGPGANAGAQGSMPPGAGGSEGGPPGAGGTSGGAKASSGSSSSGRELFVYIPENLKLATGASITVLSDSKTIGGSQLLAQFSPVLGTLARAGLKIDQIEHVWSGTSRDTGDLVICAKTRAAYTPASVTQSLGASSTSEKVGRAAVHDLPTHPVYKNAVALVDSKTILIGRRDTVIAALKNPKAGAVRQALEALNLSSPHYWIAGNDSADSGSQAGGQRLSGLGATEAAAIKPRSGAVGFGTGGPSAAAGANPGGYGQPGGPGDSADADGGAQPGGDYAAGAGGMPDGSAGANSLEIVVGLNFPSEGAATSAETKLNDMIKRAQQAAEALQGQLGSVAGQNPDAGADAGAAPANAPAAGAAGGHGDASRRMAMANMRGGGAMPGGAMPGGQPAIPVWKIVRTKENLRMTMSLPAIAGPMLFQALGNALQASGASAIGDGLFDGTLASLAKAATDWAGTKPDELRGVQRMGDLPVQQGYSWMTRLLPFVGREELFSQFDFEKSWSDGNNMLLTMNVIPAFLNPADARTQFLGNSLPGMGLTHFVGMAGVEDRRDVIAAALPRSDPRAGMFGYDQIAKPNEITDGTSQTIMMIGAGEVVAPWVQGGGATVRGARAPYFGGPGSFGSRGLPKPGTFVLFADGSSRVISADIDPEVFKAMCTIHGAEQIDLSKIAPQQQ